MEYCYRCMSVMNGRKICPVCGSRNADVQFLPHQLPPGTVLAGRYLLGRVLGKGAFGITYIGMDLHLQQKIAVKEYYPSICCTRISTMSQHVTMSTGIPYYATEGKEKFLQEARILAQFRDTEGIVNVFDYFEANGTDYIVMEYLEGQTLKEILKYRTFSPDEIFSLMLPVMDALSAVHRQNLIHRDISPDNLMLLPDHRLVLMDFGAARAYSLSNPGSMTIMVKHGYAPEEQYREHGETGPWTDVYALCATIYHCMTGVLPQNSNERLLLDELLPPSAVGVSLTHAQEAALKGGMAVNAMDRIQSMDELREVLQHGSRTAPDGGTKGHRGSKTPWVVVLIAAAAVFCIVAGIGIGLSGNWGSAGSGMSSGSVVQAEGSDHVSEKLSALRSAAIGDEVLFGACEQDTSGSAEEIIWIVLDRKEDAVLVISRYALDCRPFHTKQETVNWKHCSLRSWLNDEFLSDAFSSEEQALIRSTAISDSGSATEDRLFLLSSDEVLDYLNTDRRVCQLTEYAKTQGGDSESWWWLRSAGSTGSTAAGVGSSGVVALDGFDVSNQSGAVRPAMWISLEG